jgi:hypothetical protein
MALEGERRMVFNDAQASSLGLFQSTIGSAASTGLVGYYLPKFCASCGPCFSQIMNNIKLRLHPFHWTLAIVFCLGTQLLSTGAESDQDELERRARVINRAAQQESVFKQALHHVSIETGVPKDSIETQHRQYPDMGLAGIMLANVMAAETKKEPTEFLKQRKGGKGWVALAKANKVPLDNLNRKLENLDRAIGASTKKAPERRDRR